MFKVLLKSPFYLILLCCTAIGLAYWMGQKSTKGHGLRPAVLVKYLPVKKRRAKPFTKANTELAKKTEKQVLQHLTPKNSKETPDALKNPTNLEVDELANELASGLEVLDKATKESTARNLAVADALIEKDPDLYLAYKSKLMNLLIQEIQFGQQVATEDYEALYDEMLSFEGTSAEDEVLEEVRLTQEDEGTFMSLELEGIDQDLIHIPFLRFSALNDLESLADISEEYIEVYPDSYIGYLYLAEALWRDGDQVAAARTLQEGLKLESKEQIVLHLFSVFQQNPIERIYNFSNY